MYFVPYLALFVLTFATVATNRAREFCEGVRAPAPAAAFDGHAAAARSTVPALASRVEEEPEHAAFGGDRPEA